MSVLTNKMQRIFAPTEEEKRVLDSMASQARSVEAGENIIAKGERTWKCCLLLEGMVCRYRDLGGGRRQILSFQYPGDVFDAYSFVLEVMDHSIAAVMRSRIAYIPHETMRQVTESFPRLARAFWKDTLIDAAVFFEWMTNARGLSPHAQIAHLMCEVFVRFDVAGVMKDGTVPWPMTHVDISDALGLAPDYIRTIVEDFHRRGWITIVDGKLIVHDLERLKQEAGFDPTYLHLKPPEGAAVRLAADWIKPL